MNPRDVDPIVLVRRDYATETSGGSSAAGARSGKVRWLIIVMVAEGIALTFFSRMPILPAPSTPW